MELYIPEFWCGVVTTIFLEFAAVIGAAVVSAAKDKKKKEEKVGEKADGAVGTYDGSGEWHEES